MKMSKTYSEMIRLRSFEERYLYLRLSGSVGLETFGADRWVNQAFYKSKEWKDIRNQVIVRDEGNDLAMTGYSINDRIYIHHIDPITVGDFSDNVNKLLSLDNLVCVSFDTHQAIHYGIKDYAKINCMVDRTVNDTKLW
jgi:hypothetical protein